MSIDLAMGARTERTGPGNCTFSVAASLLVSLLFFFLSPHASIYRYTTPDSIKPPSSVLNRRSRLVSAGERREMKYKGGTTDTATESGGPNFCMCKFFPSPGLIPFFPLMIFHILSRHNLQEKGGGKGRRQLRGRQG